MAISEDVIRLVLDLRGQEAAKEFSNAIALNKVRLEELTAQWTRGEITAEEYLRTLTQVSTQTQQYNAILGQLATQEQQTAAATHQLDTSMKQVGATAGRQGNFGMAVLEGSRALEDLQYGVAGVINNIPSLVLALGGTMGLAGVISVVTVGAFQLYKHWGDLSKLWGEGATETEAERMERLAKATNRTKEEEKEYLEYKKQEAELAKQMATPAAEATKRGEEYQRALKEAGGADTQKSLLAGYRAFQLAQPGATAEGVDQAEMKEYRQQMVRRLMIDAAGGSPAALDKIAGLLGFMPAGSAFKRAFAQEEENILMGTPEARNRATLRGDAEQRRAADKELAERRKEMNIIDTDEQERQLLAEAAAGSAAYAEKEKAQGARGAAEAARLAAAREREAEMGKTEAGRALGGVLPDVKQFMIQNELAARQRGKPMSDVERMNSEDIIRRKVYEVLQGQGMDLGKAAGFANQASGLARESIQKDMMAARAMNKGLSNTDALINVSQMTLQQQMMINQRADRQEQQIKQLWNAAASGTQTRLRRP